MTYNLILQICKKGKTAIIPGWKGYLDYINSELVFRNGNYILKEKELEDKIKNRTDLYYII